MEKRIEIVKKVGRILSLALLMGVAAQMTLPVLAHARSPKCSPVPVPGQPGTYVITCTTTRP